MLPVGVGLSLPLPTPFQSSSIPNPNHSNTNNTNMNHNNSNNQTNSFNNAQTSFAPFHNLNPSPHQTMYQQNAALAQQQQQLAMQQQRFAMHSMYQATSFPPYPYPNSPYPPMMPGAYPPPSSVYGGLMSGGLPLSMPNYSAFNPIPQPTTANNANLNNANISFRPNGDVPMKNHHTGNGVRTHLGVDLNGGSDPGSAREVPRTSSHSHGHNHSTSTAHDVGLDEGAAAALSIAKSAAAAVAAAQQKANLDRTARAASSSMSPPSPEPQHEPETDEMDGILDEQPTDAFHLGEDGEEPDPAYYVPKKGSACLVCYRAKTSCDGERPCFRCVRLQKANLCEDRPKDERHPRKRKGLTQGERGAGRKRRYRKQKQAAQAGAAPASNNGDDPSDSGSEGTPATISTTHSSARHRHVVSKLKSMMESGEIGLERVAWYMSQLIDLMEPFEFDELTKELSTNVLSTGGSSITPDAGNKSECASDAPASTEVSTLLASVLRRGALHTSYEPSPTMCIETDHRPSTVDAEAASSVGGLPAAVMAPPVALLNVKPVKFAVQLQKPNKYKRRKIDPSQGVASTATGDGAPVLATDGDPADGIGEAEEDVVHQARCPFVKAQRNARDLSPGEPEETLVKVEVKTETDARTSSETPPPEEATNNSQMDTSPNELQPSLTETPVPPTAVVSNDATVPATASVPVVAVSSAPPPPAALESSIFRVESAAPSNTDETLTMPETTPPTAASTAVDTPAVPMVCTCGPVVEREVNVQANREWERLFGYNQSELRTMLLQEGGKTFARFLRMDSRIVAITAALEALITGNTEFRYYAVIVNKWMAEIHCLAVVRPGESDSPAAGGLSTVYTYMPLPDPRPPPMKLDPSQ